MIMWPRSRKERDAPVFDSRRAPVCYRALRLNACLTDDRVVTCCIFESDRYVCQTEKKKLAKPINREDVEI
jgi:hypothetical protein